MSHDPNYWKNNYKGTWGASSKREEVVAEKIRTETGKDVQLTGLGAGSDMYLSGSAQSHGFEKGAADLRIVGTRLYIEVTGPNTTGVKENEPLWIRPDKVENAEYCFPEHETWVVHHLSFNDLYRTILLDDVFFKRYHENAFAVVSPMIRGAQEHYVAIPPDDSCVLTWGALIERIKSVS